LARFFYQKVVVEADKRETNAFFLFEKKKGAGKAGFSIQGIWTVKPCQDPLTMPGSVEPGQDWIYSHKKVL